CLTILFFILFFFFFQAEDGIRDFHVTGVQTCALPILLADLGFIEARDPRFVATVEAIGRELKRGDSLFRYIAPDDFGKPETSFIICTFWYIDALAAIGRKDEARAMFNEILSRRNHLGLLSEDLAFVCGEL